MTPQVIVTLSWRALLRDWRAGELRILALALIIAVAGVAAVGFFTDRIKITMERQSSELLGADLVIDAAEPVREIVSAEAMRRGLRRAETLAFRSVVLAGDATELAEVKAVGPGYPLRGTLEVADRPFGPSLAVPNIPSSGRVWLDSRLSQVLGRGVGDTLQLGAATFRVEQILAYEPDRGGDLFSIAPRLMMNLADVAVTELIQPGSRVRHRLLVAGEPGEIEAYREWANSKLTPGERIRGVRQARPELRTALNRAQRFLGLAALVSVILAGVGIAITVRRFAARHWDSVAIMRCVGATQRTILSLFLLEMLWLWMLAGTVGGVLGYASQEGLSQILAGLAGSPLPMPSWRPLIPALATGFVALLGFGLPPLLRLRDVPPVRVLRGDIGPVDRRAIWLYGPAVLAIVALVTRQAGDAQLAIYVLGGTAGTLLALGLAAWALVKALSLLRGRAGVAWRFGLANIARRGSASAVQVVALGLGIMVMLVLGLVRNDLLSSWRDTLPPGAPNYFLINVQPAAVAGVGDFLRAHGLTEAQLHPMVRGRLAAINGRSPSADDYSSPRAQRLIEREFNLSWAAELQDDNRIVSGHWWREAEAGTPQISVEQGLAEQLGIQIDDRLLFRIAGREVEGQVTSLRSVEWDSFRANFFVLFPPGVLDQDPATWITSFHLDREQQPLLAELVRAFPSITVLDIDAIMAKVRDIIDRVTLAVEYVSLFTLLAGLVVLFAAIQATQDERRFEGAVLRTLGASRRTILKSLAAEFATLGLLAGLLAALAATIVGYVLAEHVFAIPFQFNPLVWALGSGLGMLGVGAAGLMGARSVLDRPPLFSLRER